MWQRGFGWNHLRLIALWENGLLFAGGLVWLLSGWWMPWLDLFPRVLLNPASFLLFALLPYSILAVVGDDDKAFRIRGLGADQAIVRSREDFVKASGPVDLVIAPVGGEVLAKALTALKPGGRLVTCAATAGPTATLELKPFFQRQLSILGSFMGLRSDLEAALALLAAGKVKPVVDTVFPAREAAQALSMLEGGRQFGKLVLVHK